MFPDVHHSKPSNFELTLAESEAARQGPFIGASKCFWEYDLSIFETTLHHLAERGGSKVDYVVDNKLVGMR